MNIIKRTGLFCAGHRKRIMAGMSNHKAVYLEPMIITCREKRGIFHMGRCSVIIDPVCAGHENPHHPECNSRIEHASSGIPVNIPRLIPEPAHQEDLERVHDPSYLAWLEQKCSSVDTLGWLDSDTYITRQSFLAALHSAGGAIAAVEKSRQGEHCFALVRPPGHHAMFNRALGFCLINNVADSFYGTDRVLYCSVHQEHFFPYSGTVGEVGMGEGKGYTMNAPLQPGSTIADYYHVFSEIFVPAIERLSPEVVIISAGQDILFDDPLGMMGIKPGDFELLTRLIARAAMGPLALVLEGGYGPSHGEAVHSIFSALTSEGRIHNPGDPSAQTKAVVSWLKSVHNLF